MKHKRVERFHPELVPGERIILDGRPAIVDRVTITAAYVKRTSANGVRTFAISPRSAVERITEEQFEEMKKAQRAVPEEEPVEVN